MKVAKHYVVHGRVQGVGYRSFAATCAEALGVTGWCRNTPEGTVEVHAEGTEEQLKEFAFDLSRGSRYARVSDVQGTDVAVENHATFRQLR